MTAGQQNRIIALAALAAILLAFTVDHPIARAMAGTYPAVLSAARFVTWFGQGAVVLYPTGIMILIGLVTGILRPNFRRWLDPLLRWIASIFIVVAAAGLSDDALKVIFGRARPYIWLAGDDSGFGFFRYGARFASFPSGHTTTSVAAALVLSALFPRLRPVFLGFAVLIAASRIVLDAHYLSDVLAGATLGWAVATALIGTLKKRGFLRA